MLRVPELLSSLWRRLSRRRRRRTFFPRRLAALQILALLILALALLDAGVSVLWGVVVLPVFLATTVLLYSVARQRRRLVEAREEMVETHFATAKAVVLAQEERDPLFRGHGFRVRSLTTRILNYMDVDPPARRAIEMAATLHDLGKVGIPDSILGKRGPLSESERSRVMRHVDIGVEVLGSLSTMGEVGRLVRHHHESFDGSGYPVGLAGEDIPLGSRIVAVADAIDAMRSDRSYRVALDVNETIAELRRVSGSQLDPRIVDIAIGVLRSQELRAEPTREFESSSAQAPVLEVGVSSGASM